MCRSAVGKMYVRRSSSTSFAYDNSPLNWRSANMKMFAGEGHMKRGRQENILGAKEELTRYAEMISFLS